MIGSQTPSTIRKLSLPASRAAGQGRNARGPQAERQHGPGRGHHALVQVRFEITALGLSSPTMYVHMYGTVDPSLRRLVKPTWTPRDPLAEAGDS
jgi:hypothetical protein